MALTGSEFTPIMSDAMLNIAAFIIFVLVVGVYIYKDRKNIKLEGIILMRRTEKGKKSIDNSVKKHPTFWRIMGVAGLVIAIPAMIFISYFVVSNGLTVLSGVKTETVKLVLPYTEAGSAPGVFFLPWYFWIIGIAVIVIPHELFHGFMCRLHKIKVKSLGWFLLAVLPGAFVEPDKKSLDNASLKAKLKVAAAGSFANIITAVIALAVSLALVLTLFAPAGMSVSIIANNTYPAYNANLSGYITEINSVQIRSAQDLVLAMDGVNSGDDVKITTNKGNYIIKTIENPDKPGKAFIGIIPRSAVNQPKDANTAPIVNFFSDLFMWIFVLSLGIGLFNLLPIKPLDGGMILEETLKSKIPKYAKPLTIIISLIMAAFIIISLVGPLLL